VLVVGGGSHAEVAVVLGSDCVIRPPRCDVHSRLTAYQHKQVAQHGMAAKIWQQCQKMLYRISKRCGKKRS
jgi:hypothetical protein